MSHRVQKGDICWPPVLISSMLDGEAPRHSALPLPVCLVWKPAAREETHSSRSMGHSDLSVYFSFGLACSSQGDFPGAVGLGSISERPVRGREQHRSPVNPHTDPHPHFIGRHSQTVRYPFRVPPFFLLCPIWNLLEYRVSMCSFGPFFVSFFLTLHYRELNPALRPCKGSILPQKCITSPLSIYSEIGFH